MSVSGTYTYNLTANSIINGALRLCGAIDPENTAAPTSNQIANALEALNLLLKGWEANGLQLWQRKYGAVFMQSKQGQYVLGSPGPGGDHATLSTPIGSNFVQTTIISGGSTSSTSIVVNSISNTGTIGTPAISMLTTWYIGIYLDSGKIQWTTINGAPSGTTITLATGLTGTASVGNYVFSYQTKLMRPLRILDGFVRQVGTSDVPCLIIPRENYNRFGQKSSSGTGIQLYYDPQELTGNLYVYPANLDPRQILYIEFDQPMSDISSVSDNVDCPQEWLEALKFNLARRIAPEYSVPKDKYMEIKEQADQTFLTLNSWDQEYASVYIQPSNWSYYQDAQK